MRQLGVLPESGLEPGFCAGKKTGMGGIVVNVRQALIYALCLFDFRFGSLVVKSQRGNSFAAVDILEPVAPNLGSLPSSGSSDLACAVQSFPTPRPDAAAFR